MVWNSSITMEQTFNFVMPSLHPASFITRSGDAYMISISPFRTRVSLSTLDPVNNVHVVNLQLTSTSSMARGSPGEGVII